MVALAILFVCFVLAFIAHERQAVRYEGALDALRAERDQARKEANDLRIAIFPSLGRVGKTAEPVAIAQPAPPPKPLTKQEQAQVIWRDPRKSTRQKIKETMALNNSKQQHFDATVQAIQNAEKETADAAQAG